MIWGKNIVFSLSDDCDLKKSLQVCTQAHLPKMVLIIIVNIIINIVMIIICTK